jgi:para-nitrobenzyl esterase
MTKALVTVPEGILEGVSQDGVRRFFSVPYAAPMTDANRLREPQPVERWSGTRDATQYGPSAPQSRGNIPGIDMTTLVSASTATGPDYLTLNIFAPEGEAQGRPVMVFVHGGSFVAGSKDAAVYDGSQFARDGVVCVTVNYRLGIEGFLPIAGAPTNLGLRDIIAALKWVRARIGTFGGDPDNITLFGESAGACCVSLLLLSPLAQGLFRRAICESGHPYLTRNIASLQRIVKRLAKRLRISPDRSGFTSVPAEKLLPAQERMMRPSLWPDMRDAEGRDLAFGGKFVPVHGDDVVPERPLEALSNGAGRDVQLLIGTTAEEANLFFVPNGMRERMRRWQILLLMRRLIPNARQALRAYGFDAKGATPGDALTRLMTDLFFRCPARRTAELHRGRTWVFEFDWRSPALEGQLGAAHAIELPFVFDTLSAASGSEGLVGTNPPQALADSVHALWVRFATDGSLPWSEFDAERRQVYSLSRQTAEYEAPMPAAAFLP